MLGDFETAGFAGSKRRHSVPAPAGRRLRSLARQVVLNPAPSYDYSAFNESKNITRKLLSTLSTPRKNPQASLRVHAYIQKLVK
ncbi:hypothetical protein LCUW1_00002350, partial [Lactobacillus casei]|nr:hypothetical protein [Lacticaseibacillus casei]